MAFRFVPAHVNETTDPVDNLGGILSVVLVGALILAINFAPVPNEGTLVLGARGDRASRRWSPSYIRQRRAKNPLYDLDVAGAAARSGSRPVAGIIVFGSLMGAMFIGQQFLQNVLGYSTLDAGAGDPAGGRLHGAGRAALGQARRGARRPVHAAARLRLLPARLPRRCCCCGRRASRTGRSALGYAFIGIGVGFAGTPASHSLTGSVPVHARGHGVGHRRPAARPGRRDHAVDLRRAAHRRLRGGDGGGDRASPDSAQVTDSVAEPAHEVLRQRRRTSRSSTRSTRRQITAAAKTSFLQGDQWAYTAGIVAVLLGAALVFFLFPKKDEEEQLLARYHAEDVASHSGG